MAISPGDSLDTQLLGTAWQAGARLASQRLPGRAPEVIKAAARNLSEISMPEAAASLHMTAGDKRSAVMVLFNGGMEAKARQIAAGDPILEDLVEQLATAAAAGGADPRGGLEGSVSLAELDDLARRGNWAQVRARSAPVPPPRIAQRRKGLWQPRWHVFLRGLGVAGAHQGGRCGT